MPAFPMQFKKLGCPFPQNLNLKNLAFPNCVGLFEIIFGSSVKLFVLMGTAVCSYGENINLLVKNFSFGATHTAVGTVGTAAGKMFEGTACAYPRVRRTKFSTLNFMLNLVPTVPRYYPGYLGTRSIVYFLCVLDLDIYSCKRYVVPRYRRKTGIPAIYEGSVRLLFLFCLF